MTHLRDSLIAEAEAADAEAMAAEARAADAREKAQQARSKRSAPDRVAGVDSQARPRRTVSWSRVVIAAGLVITCAALALTAYMVRYDARAKATTSRDTEYADAARRGVEALLSIDYARAHDDVQRVVDASTGSFRDEFARNAEEFIKAAVETQSVSTGDVTAAALETRTGDSATVAVAANSQVTNANGAQQEPRAWRIVVTVVPDGDQLKMSNVEFLP